MTLRSLHVVHSLDRRIGGCLTAALGVVEQLALAGQPAELVGTHAPGEDLGHIQEAFPHVVAHPMERSFPARSQNSAGMRRWLDGNVPRFDIVDVHGVFNLAVVNGVRAARRHRRPYVLRPHGTLDPLDLAKKGWLKRWLVGPGIIRGILQDASGVLCTSRLEAERLETYGATPRTHVIPLPVPPMGPAPAGAREAFRRRHGVPVDAEVVLFLSRWDSKKGLEFLIPALARLKAVRPRLWFVLAGSGEPAFAAQVERWLGEAGISGWTRRVGFLSGDEKRAAFAASDVFALPSRYENFGIVVVEALQAGVPTVISNQVYIHEEIHRAGAGVICRPDSVSCEEALGAVLGGRVEGAGLRERGRRAAVELFSPEAATRRLLDVYGSIVEGFRGARSGKGRDGRGVPLGQ